MCEGVHIKILTLHVTNKLQHWDVTCFLHLMEDVDKNPRTTLPIFLELAKQCEHVY